MSGWLGGWAMWRGGSGWLPRLSGTGAANAGSLDELNGLISYNLSDKLLDFYGNDTDTNPYSSTNSNSIFYDTCTFTTKFKNSPSSIYISLNIRSLQCNHLPLCSMINDFLKNNINVDVIALQEIWNIQHIEAINIPGFNFVHEQRKSSRGGGVGFFIAEKFNYKILNGLSIFREKTFESLTLELSLCNKKSLITNIYRSPTPPPNVTQGTHMADFLQTLDVLLNNLSIINSDSTVFLDSNINLLNIDRNQTVADYLQIVHTNSFLQTINKATRIFNNTYSLIDHILEKNRNNDSLTGVIISDISDHFITFTAKQIKTPRTNNLCKNLAIFVLQI